MAHPGGRAAACDGSGSRLSTVGATASPSTVTVGELADSAASSDAHDELEWAQVALPPPYVDGVEFVTAGEDGYAAVLAKGLYGDRSLRLFTSVDGRSWRAAGDLPPIDTHTHLDFAAADGLWVGAARQSDDVLVSVDGRSWTVAALPFDDRLVGDESSVELRTRITSVAIDDDSITVLATQRAAFLKALRDRYEASPARSTEGDPDTWSTWGYGDDGAGNVTLYKESDVVASFDAVEELGISPEAVAQLVSGRRIALRSADQGATWGELTMPTTSPGPMTSAIGFDDTIYGLFESGPHSGGSAVHRLDGDEWTRVDVESGALPSALAVFDDQLYGPVPTAAGPGRCGARPTAKPGTSSTCPRSTMPPTSR